MIVKKVLEAKTTAIKILLFCAICDAVSYNITMTLQTLDESKQTGKTFVQWFEVLRDYTKDRIRS